MEFSKLSQRDIKQVIPLLSNYFEQQGRVTTQAAIRKLLQQDFSNSFFVLKDGQQIVCCASLHAYSDGHALIDHFIVHTKEAAHTTTFVSSLLQHCQRNNIESLHALIPKEYEASFIQQGFTFNSSSVPLTWHKKNVEKQSDLKEKLHDIAAMEDIAGETSERLRKLKIITKK